MSDVTAGAGQSPTERMVAMLADPTALFDRSQAVFLMASAARWAREGEYERGRTDGSLAGRQELASLMMDALAAPAPPLTEQWLRVEGGRQRARREHDIAAAFPWRGDHPGGPVAWVDNAAADRG